jgi:gamma-tubulin complex component 3
LTFLHTYTSNGDPFIRTFSSRLLRILSVPFFSILSAWIYEGELRDPFSEFFVAVDPLLEGRDEGDMTLGTDGMGGGYENTTLGKVRGGEVWEGKFIFKKELLPAFLEEDFGRKVSYLL